MKISCEKSICRLYTTKTNTSELQNSIEITQMERALKSWGVVPNRLTHTQLKAQEKGNRAVEILEELNIC